MRWWEQEGMYLEEMRMAAQEAERREGGEELGGAETATDDWLSGEDTVVNINLGTDPNAPLAYAPVLELHHPIMSKFGGHRGQ